MIDCVGVTGKASLCTAPSLLGIDLSTIPEKERDVFEGMLFELPEKAELAADCPESWIRNVEIVNVWAKEQSYQTHGVNWFKMPDGSLVCSLLNRRKITIPCPDALGMVRLEDGTQLSMQEALDLVYGTLCSEYSNQRYIWDLNEIKRWGRKPASDKQLSMIHRRCKGFDTDGLTKFQASQILNRLMNGVRYRVS